MNSVLLGVPLLLAVAIGQTFVIASRGIDVSVGSALGLSAMIAGLAFKGNPGLPVWAGALIALGCGGALGALNGVLIVAARVPPIVATLGALSAFRGLTFLASSGDQVDSNHIPSGITMLSLEGPLRGAGVLVPWLLLISLAAAVAGYMLARRTRLGRNVYAVGSNPEAALLRGVPVSRTLFAAYTLSGVCAGLGGFLYMSRFGFVNPGTAGLGFELPVIAATVIGGCEVRGGTGSIIGTVLGCLVLATINVALAVLGIAADWQLLVYGAVILVALTLDTVIERRGLEQGATT